MIKRFFTVSVVVLTIFWAVGLTAFVPTAQAAISSGDLIKASLPAVYYYGADGKRYVFPDEKTYKTWYPDFSGVKTITDAELAAIQIGGNVTYKPGAKMIKITTDPKVYAVQSNGTLRWVTTEAIAVCLYGATWNTMVNDVPDPFFVNYTVGAPINACTDYDKAAALAAAVSINVDKGLATGGNQAAFNAVLASDNPAPQTLALKATGVPVLKFTLSGSGTLNEVVLKRTGLGSSADYVGVYLYKGDVRLTSGRSISSDTNTVTFTNINLAISGSVTLIAKVDVTDDNTKATDQNALSVNSINGNAVAGVMGNLMTIGNAAASDVDIARTSATWNVTLGTAGAELAKFSIMAGANDAVLYAITLRNGGRLANANLKNLKLKSGSYELASTAALDSDKAVFVLGAPFTITKGQTKNFTVIGDITGGRTGDDVQFYIDQRTDVSILDGLYGVGANVIIDVNFDAPGDQIVNIQGGQITLGNAGPAASTFSASSTGNAIQKVNVSSERNVTVRKTYILITAAGTMADADTARIKNIKLSDLDSGASLIYISDLVGFKAVADDTTCNTAADAAGGCYLLSSDTYDLTAGSMRHLAIKADFDTNITDGVTLSSTFDLGFQNNMVYDNDSSEYVDAANIVPDSLAGVTHSVTTSALTVTKAGIPTTGSFVQGTSAVDALGINFTAGVADSMKLNRLTAKIYGDDDGNFGAGTGDTAANYIAMTASLLDGSTVIKGPINLTLNDANSSGDWTAGEWYKADFTNLGYAIPAGSQKKLVVRLALRNTMAFPPANYYLAVDLDVPDDLEVENSIGNLVDAGAAADLNLLALPNPYAMVSESGSLDVSVDGNTPKADVVVGGSSNLAMAKYEFTATDEAFTIVGAKIYGALIGGTDINSDVLMVKVTYQNASGSTVTKSGEMTANGTDAELVFTDGQLDMYVPVNSSAVMTISANLNWVGAGANSRDEIALCLDNGSACADGFGGANLTDEFIALGVSSNVKLFGAADAISLDNEDIKNQTTNKTKVVCVNTHPGGATSVGPQTIVGKLKCTSTSESGSGQKSVLNSLDVQLNGGFIAGASAGNELVRVRVYSGSIDVANEMTDSTVTTNITNVDAGTSTLTTVPLAYNNKWDGDTDILVVIASTDDDFADTTANDALSTTTETFEWDDGTTAGANSTPVYGIPIIPTNALLF